MLCLSKQLLSELIKQFEIVAAGVTLFVFTMPDVAALTVFFRITKLSY